MKETGFELDLKARQNWESQDQTIQVKIRLGETELPTVSSNRETRQDFRQDIKHAKIKPFPPGMAKLVSP